jgi:hypothetical protein
MLMSTRHSLAGESLHHKLVKAGLTGKSRLPFAAPAAARNPRAGHGFAALCP